jgi:hypothetical protein
VNVMEVLTLEAGMRSAREARNARSSHMDGGCALSLAMHECAIDPSNRQSFAPITHDCKTLEAHFVDGIENRTGKPLGAGALCRWLRSRSRCVVTSGETNKRERDAAGERDDGRSHER